MAGALGLALPSERQSRRNCETRRSLAVTARRDMSTFIGLLRQPGDVVKVPAASAKSLQRMRDKILHLALSQDLNRSPGPNPLPFRQSASSRAIIRTARRNGAASVSARSFSGRNGAKAPRAHACGSEFFAHWPHLVRETGPLGAELRFPSATSAATRLSVVEVVV